MFETSKRGLGRLEAEQQRTWLKHLIDVGVLLGRTRKAWPRRDIRFSVDEMVTLRLRASDRVVKAIVTAVGNHQLELRFERLPLGNPPIREEEFDIGVDLELLLIGERYVAEGIELQELGDGCAIFNHDGVLQTGHRRAYFREPIALPFELQVKSEWIEGTTIEIGGGGLSAKFTQQIEDIGTEVHFRILFEQKYLEGTCAVCWHAKKEGGYHYGFEFKNVIPTAFQTLYRTIFELQTKRRQLAHS